MDLDAPGRSARSKRSRYGDCWKEVVSVCRTSSDISTSSSRAKSKDGICASSDDDGWEGVATVRRTTSARSASSVAEDRNDEDGSPRGGDGDANKGDDDVRSSGVVEDQAAVESEPPAAAPSAPSEPIVTAAPTEEEAADAGPADEESNVLSPEAPAVEEASSVEETPVEETPVEETPVDACKDDGPVAERDDISASKEETSNPSEPAVTVAPTQDDESTDIADDAVDIEPSRSNEVSLDEPEPKAVEAATTAEEAPVDAKDDKSAAAEETKPDEVKRAKRRPFAFPKMKRTVSWRKPKFLGKAPAAKKASLRDDENGRQRGDTRKDTTAVHGPALELASGHSDQLEDRNDDQPEDRSCDPPEELFRAELVSGGGEDALLSEEILSEESCDGPVIEVRIPENGAPPEDEKGDSFSSMHRRRTTKAEAELKKKRFDNRNAGCVETLLLCGEEDSSSSESRSEELEDEAHVTNNVTCNMRTHEENEAEFWSSIFIEGLDWVKEGTAQLLPEEYRATTEMEGLVSAESFATNVSAVATVIGEGLECGAELWSGAATAIERKKLERKKRRSGSRRTTKPRTAEPIQDPLLLALREERERPAPRELDPFGNAEDPPNDVDKAACTADPKEEDPASEVDAACTATPEEETKTSRVDVPASPLARARSFERMKSIVRRRSFNKRAGTGEARSSALSSQPTGASLAMRSEAKRKVRQGKQMAYRKPQPPTKSTKRLPRRKVDKYGNGAGDVF